MLSRVGSSKQFKLSSSGVKLSIQMTPSASMVIGAGAGGCMVKYCESKEDWFSLKLVSVCCIIEPTWRLFMANKDKMN